MVPAYFPVRIAGEIELEQHPLRIKGAYDEPLSKGLGRNAQGKNQDKN